MNSGKEYRVRSRRIFLLSCAPLLFAAGAVFAQSEIDKLKERIDALEVETRLNKEDYDALLEELEGKIKIGGYVDLEYTQDSRDQIKPGFRIHHFSLFFKQKISERWRFFSEIEYEDGPSFDFRDGLTAGAGKIFVEAVNFDYEYKPELIVRGGRFFTPAGIWSVDHYPPFVPTQERPLHIRKIFPQIIDGLMTYGTHSVGSVIARYEGYVGNGEGNDDEGKEDDNTRKSYGVKISLLPITMQYLDFGASYYSDRRADNGQEIDAAGLHAKLRLGSATFQGEYATGDIKTVSGSSFTRSGYYAQLMYDIETWTVGGRHDIYESDDTLNVEETRKTAFINHHVSANVVLKLEHHIHEYENPAQQDYNLSIASIAYYLAE